MNTAVIGKIMGWSQFALQFFGQLVANGMPTTWPQWVGAAGSLIAAIGIHAAASTDGSK